MSGIPTRYAGVQFRSRLEARWAALFDQLGVPWEYEPRDFRGWVPDFQVTDYYGERRLVEVSPREHLESHRQKIEGSGCREEVLLVCAPLELGEAGKRGRGRTRAERAWVWRTGRLLPVLNSTVPGVAWLYWDHEVLEPVADRLRSAWREAGNLTQWRPPDKAPAPAPPPAGFDEFFRGLTREESDMQQLCQKCGAVDATTTHTCPGQPAVMVVPNEYVPDPSLGVDARRGRCHEILADGFRCHGEQGHLGYHWRWAEV